VACPLSGRSLYFATPTFLMKHMLTSMFVKKSSVEISMSVRCEMQVCPTDSVSERLRAILVEQVEYKLLMIKHES